VGYGVHAFDLGAGTEPLDLGTERTNGNGMFIFEYAALPGGADDQAGTRGFLLRILDLQGAESVRREIEVGSDQQRIVQVRIAVPKPPSVALSHLESVLGLGLPPAVVSTLAARGIHTIADLREAGGVSAINGLPVAQDHPAVQTLEAHAKLSVLPADIQTNAALISRGYTSLSAIARPSQADFVTRMHGMLDAVRATVVHEAAKAQTYYLDKLVIERQMASPDTSIGDGTPAPFTPPCSCCDCMTAVSPLAYLADLLDYAVESLQNNSAAITLQDLTDMMHQPFGDLIVSCDERTVLQVRLCIEALRRYLKTTPAIDTTSQDRAFLQAAYLDLLERIGTSYGEIRLAQTADPTTQQALLTRLGFDAIPPPGVDPLKTLLLDPQSALTSQLDPAVEALFGLVQTQVEPIRNPLSDGIVYYDNAQSQTTQSQIVIWNLEGAAWGRNLASDGRVYVSMTKPAGSNVAVELYRDSARTQSVARGLADPATNVAALVEQHHSGLSGRIEVAYTHDDTAHISLGVFSNVLSWRLAHLRTLWTEQDRPFNRFTDTLVNPTPDTPPNLPIIDPDVIGPDDFRYPFAGRYTPLDGPFDLWLVRRQWIDERLSALRQLTPPTQPIPSWTDLVTTIAGVFPAYPHFSSPGITVPSTWPGGTTLSDLDSLLDDLGQKTTAEDAGNRLVTLFHLTQESFLRLMAIRAKDQTKVADDEWQEVYNILVQAQKVALFELWRAEEEKNQITLGPDQFWIALRTATEGDWPPPPPAPPAPQPPAVAPWVDPEVLKLAELPEATAGRNAIALWNKRAAKIEQTRKDLKAHRLAAGGSDANGFDAVLTYALVDPTGSDPQAPTSLATLKLDLDQLQAKNDSGDQTTKETALAQISAEFHLTLDDFLRLVEVKAKVEQPAPQNAPLSPQEWADLYALLATALKGRALYPAWAAEEQIFLAEPGLNPGKAAYWRALKAALPAWLAPSGVRQEWQQALLAHSEAPIVDPDLLLDPDDPRTYDSDLNNPATGDSAYERQKARRTNLDTRFASYAPTGPTATGDTTLLAFDTLLVNSLFGDGGARSLLELQAPAAPQGTLAFDATSAELAAAQTAGATLDALLQQTLGTPMPDFATLNTSLTIPAEAAKATATITSSLYLTLADFAQIRALKLRNDDPAHINPLSSADWNILLPILARSALVGSVMRLDDEDQNGEDITPRLDQLGLTQEAFAYLVGIRKVAASGATVAPGEWDAVKDILLQSEKLRAFGTWRDKERTSGLTLAPEEFKFPEVDLSNYPPPPTFTPHAWRASLDARNTWQDTLQTRMDIEAATIAALHDAIDATEEVTLPPLRDSLIAASGAAGNTLAAKADWVTNAFMIDAKMGGCQKTTRTAQAIETVQDLIFAVRTGQLILSIYPKLVLIDDDFDAKWTWVGSYATWRAAMFVFLFPENIAIPSLRSRYTPAFRALVNNLRSNTRLTPEQACQAASEYADYFHDVCTLTIGASCQAMTQIHAGEDCLKHTVPGKRMLAYFFAQGGATQNLYWSSYDPSAESVPSDPNNPQAPADDYAQTYWTQLPKLAHATIIGAVPYEPPHEERRYIYLFAQVNDQGTWKINYIKYNLETENWDPEPTDLDGPDNEINWTAVVKQSASGAQPPHLAFQLQNKAILDRRLNRQGNNWEAQDFRTLIDDDIGKTHGELQAMVEYEATSFYLFLANSGNIHYKLFRLFDTPFYRLYSDSLSDHLYTRDRAERDQLLAKGYVSEGIEGLVGYLGAMPTDDGAMEALYRFHHEEATLHHYTSRASDRAWLLSQNFKDEGIAGYIYGASVTGAAELLELYRDAPDDQKSDRDEFLTVNAADASYAEQTWSFKPLGWTLGYITYPEWREYLLGRFVGAFSRGLGKGIYVAWEHNGVIQYGLLQDPTNAITAEANAILSDGSRLAPHSGSSDPSETGPLGAETGSSRYYLAYTPPATSGKRGMYCATLQRTANAWRADAVRDRRIAPVVQTVALGGTLPASIAEALDPFDISAGFTALALQWRQDLTATMFAANQPGPRSNLTYLEEAYYFVPVHLALQLTASGQYTGALDWLRTVYDYEQPINSRKIYVGLSNEEAPTPKGYVRPENWLLDPLNPHAIAEGRQNTYTRFTLQTIVRCLLAYADDRFTLDTPETVQFARQLYMTALRLLDDTPELQQAGDSCDNLIGELIITIGNDPTVAGWNSTVKKLSTVTDFKVVKGATDRLHVLRKAPIPPETRLAQARTIVDAALAAQPATRTLTATRAYQAQMLGAAYDTLLREPGVAEATKRVGSVAANDYALTLARVAGVPISSGPTGQVALPVQQPQYATPPPAPNTGGGVWVPPPPPGPMVDAAVQQSKAYGAGFIPSPHFAFCIPPNPVLNALRLHAELNLFKIRTCRNIAGQERELDFYAAPTDAVSGLPSIGAGGQLVLPGTVTFHPTSYRFTTLIERAKQLVQLAAQTEAAMLAAIEKHDAEAYSALKARQDVSLTRAQVRLQDLRVREAEDGVQLAELQKSKAQDQFDHYNELLQEGVSALELASLAFLGATIGLNAGAATAAFAEQQYASAIGSLAGAAQATSTLLSTMASFERRREEQIFARLIAQDDVKIGAQQVKIANDQVRVVGQERNIASIQADHAQATVDYLATKFTNVELYDFISDTLQGIYRYHLQQATAIALLATGELAFERQETPPPFIQADYWEPPSDMGASGSGQAPDRRGLTGSARLLQDIVQLEQYAFDRNVRRLQLSKTLLLSELAPAEFQRFRETGVLPFTTTLAMFDHERPGDYLCLIRQVRVSVVALIPPNLGIRATLSSTGTSRVVIPGDVFQTVVVKRPPESIGLSAPVNATGISELDPQADMLRPFENLGVAGSYEFRMPKAANPFDFSTIAEVMVTHEYSALHSDDYYQQVIQTMRPTLSSERPFSFRYQLADQWYDLHNPDQAPLPPMTVRFTTTRADFPPNLAHLKIQNVLLYFARADGKTFEVLNTKLHFTAADGGAPVGGSANSIDGLISTRSGNAGSWAAIQGATPFGEWELALPLDVQTRFANEEITDILFVITYSGRVPEWPT
jgi:hypothetical protein